jgi:hypothetical protein
VVQQFTTDLSGTATEKENAVVVTKAVFTLLKNNAISFS